MHLLPLLAALAPLAPATAAPAPLAVAARATAVLPHISLQSFGQGSPVVLIPRLSTPRVVWDGLAPELARTHRVILVQVNGFGADAPGANLSPGLLEGAVTDLYGYLARQKLGGVAVIGHSLGGLAALMLAKAHHQPAAFAAAVHAFMAGLSR